MSAATLASNRPKYRLVCVKMTNLRTLAATSILALSLFIANQPVKTILIAPQAKQATNESQVSTNLTVVNQQSLVRLDSNSSFYYDSDAFLLNKSPAASKPTPKRNETSSDDEKDQKTRPERAGRGGRMLNLDAFVGDSDALSARSMPNTGNRQSRTLSSGEHIDVGNGKKMKVQGFIPIMGLAEEDEDSMSSSQSTKNPSHRPRELPYGQSSLGHASFGIQRYLNTEQQQQQQPQSSFDNQDAMLMSMLLQQQQHLAQQAAEQKLAPTPTQTASTSSSNSVVEALKKPIKKLSSTFSSSASALGDSQSCLCVPFYMCKGGFLGESNLSRVQLQQMIAQHQQSIQSQQPRHLAPDSQAAQMRPLEIRQTISGSAESVPYVDERSFERQNGEQQDIVTAPPAIGASESQFDSSATSATDSSLPSLSELQSQETEKLREQQQQQNQNPNQQQPAQDPAEQSQSFGQTASNSSTDYSQDILGRMLGLKAPQLGRVSGPSAQAHQSCGLLRTCCAVPAHLLAAHSDLFAGQANFISPQQQQQQQQQQQSRPSVDYLAQKQLNQALQKYPQPLPYGLPSSGLVQVALPGRAASFMNRISSNHYSSGKAAPTAPRSPANLYAPQQLGSQVSQLTRAASFLAPAPAAAPMAQAFATNQAALLHHHHHSAQQGQQASALVRQLPLSSIAQLGTRRLLEGRCGLRQSAGITGRVQNLQYHESSADFGEYPAQAAILKRLNGNESLFVCAGTLISQQWVATAAHCIKKHSLGELKVRLGEWDVHRDDEFYAYVEMEIRDLVVHPEFMPANLINDLALLRLRAPLDPSLAHINPACLPTVDESFRGQKCWVTGWGKDSFGQRGSFQAVLQEVELPVHGHAECEQALRNTRLGPHYRLHAGFICAGGEGGRDACEGDGGSGLYCSTDGGPLKVAGLVSWGIGCGQQGVPGVYVSMAHYRPWIENIISIDEDLYSSSYAAPALQSAASPVSTLISERSNSQQSASAANITLVGASSQSANSTSST